MINDELLLLGVAMAVINIGSLNIDYVYKVPHFLRAGETLRAENRAVHPGGKGLNQSIGVARASMTVFHTGAVGYDGDLLVNTLKRDGVDLTHLDVHDKDPSGHTVIQVTPDGENCILYFPGTNEAVTVERVMATLDRAQPDDLVMLQNELPNTTLMIEAACARGLRTILNPSPFDDRLADAPFEKLYALIVNETEASQLLGVEQGELDKDELMDALIARLPNVRLILTLGSHGSCGYDPDTGAFRVRPMRVKAVDTTGAGDTFAGFVVASLARGEALEAAMRRATVAAAISVTREGAATSIPTLDEVLVAEAQYDAGE